MVERALSMREAPGSIPGISSCFILVLRTHQPDTTVKSRVFILIGDRSDHKAGSPIHVSHVMEKKIWRCRGSNPGPHTCKACALPLSYIPIYTGTIHSQYCYSKERHHHCSEVLVDLCHYPKCR